MRPDFPGILPFSEFFQTPCEFFSQLLRSLKFRLAKPFSNLRVSHNEGSMYAIGEFDCQLMFQVLR
jgi:hypothetical protein